jgi:hypothetical protein
LLGGGQILEILQIFISKRKKMRRVRLTEGQLHNVIRHAVNEALDDDEPSFKTQTDYILKGMFIRRSSVSGNDEEPEREWNENIKTCSLPTLIKSLCEKHDLIFDMHSLFYDLGDDTYIYTSVYPHNKPSFKTEYIFKIRKETISQVDYDELASCGCEIDG